MKRLYRNSKEGDMGIGTMILFIAMVLVAAVAAALLISTAGELNQQAQETGRLARQDVASSFQVIEVIGEVPAGTDPATIHHIFLKIRLVAGSPAIDMDNAVIEVLGESFEASLIYGDYDDDGVAAYDAGASTYAVELPITTGGDDRDGLIRDPDTNFDSDGDGALESTDKHIVSQGTMLMVHIDLNSAGSALSPQDTLFVKIIPKHGAPTIEEINIPEVIYSHDTEARFFILT